MVSLSREFVTFGSILDEGWLIPEISMTYSDQWRRALESGVANSTWRHVRPVKWGKDIYAVDRILSSTLIPSFRSYQEAMGFPQCCSTSLLNCYMQWLGLPRRHRVKTGHSLCHQVRYIQVLTVFSRLVTPLFCFCEQLYYSIHQHSHNSPVSRLSLLLIIPCYGRVDCTVTLQGETSTNSGHNFLRG